MFVPGNIDEYFVL